MKKQTNKAILKYYRQAKHEIPLCYSSKKEYLSNLQDTLDNIIIENPEISYPELINTLGVPKQQTKEYAELLSADELYKNIYTARRQRRVIVAVSIILATIICIATGQILDKYIKSKYYVIVNSPTIIEEHEIDDADISIP